MLSGLSSVLWVALIVVTMLAVRGLAARPLTSGRKTVSSPATALPTGCLASGDGYLRMRLRHADAPDEDIDWKNAEMECDGGLRPGGAGMRMVFAGPLPDGHRLRVVFGATAAPDVAVSRDVPTNITVIYEDEQQVFSTAGDNKCTMDALTLQPRDAAVTDRRMKHYLARGFCLAAATRVPDGKALLIDRFDFLGVVFDENAH
ncbi:MAG TPA: hypothetical protein VHZ99_00640 [Steroidobacteraceae bacterium]|nr:hypothetical protein [Steroidobacteraceae bacterium]